MFRNHHVSSIFQTLIYRISNLKLCAFASKTHYGYIVVYTRRMQNIVEMAGYKKIGCMNKFYAHRQNMCSRIQNQKFNYILIALWFFQKYIHSERQREGGREEKKMHTK
jgi:hypothetical protein